MSLVAFAAAIVGLCAPGASLARWARNRGEEPLGVAAAAVGGLGVSMVAIWSMAMALGFRSPAILGGPLLAAALIAALTDRASDQRAIPDFQAARGVAVVAVILVVAFLIPFAPHGLASESGVHRISMTDWGKHLAFVTELTANDAFPVLNPYLPASGPSPYYAGFHVLAAALARGLGGPGAAFPSLLLLTLVLCAALPLVAYVVARDLSGCSRKAVLATAGACLLGGWDMIAVAVSMAGNVLTEWPLGADFESVRAVVPSINPDFWNHHNERQFDAPYRALLWAPHHVLAALLALLAIRWLQLQHRPPSWRTGLVCGVLLAGCAAASAYVALAAAVWLSAAFVADCVARRSVPWSSPLFPGWSVAGSSAVLFGLPILFTFRAAEGASLGIHISAAGGLANGALFSALLGDGGIARLLDTPAVLLIEFGIIGVLACVALRRRMDEGTAPTTVSVSVAAAAVLIFVTLVRPPDGPNNLHARGLLIVWFVAAALAVEAWTMLRRGPLVRAAATVAALYVPYAVLGATLEGALFWATPAADHAISEWVSEYTPDDAVVAFPSDPPPANTEYWLRRRIVFDDERLARLFGAGEVAVERTESGLAASWQATDRTAAAHALSGLGATWVIYRVEEVDFWEAASTGCLADRFEAGSWRAAEITLAECD